MKYLDASWTLLSMLINLHLESFNTFSTYSFTADSERSKAIGQAASMLVSWCYAWVLMLLIELSKCFTSYLRENFGCTFHEKFKILATLFMKNFIEIEHSKIRSIPGCSLDYFLQVFKPSSSLLQHIQHLFHHHVFKKMTTIWRTRTLILTHWCENFNINGIDNASWKVHFSTSYL